MPDQTLEQEWQDIADLITPSSREADVLPVLSAVAVDAIRAVQQRLESEESE